MATNEAEVMNPDTQSFTAADFQNFAKMMAQATSRSNTNLLQDPSSCYYLHPSETPGIALTTTPLTTLNYHTWSRSVWICLKSKNKIRFIDGTLLKPAPTDDSYDAWDRCNTFVLSWLHGSLNPEILQSVLWCDNAHELWKDLKHRFYEGDLFRIAELEEDLFSTKQVLLKRLPDVNTVFSLLLQQERQMMHLIEPDSRMLVNAVYTKSIGEKESYQISQGSVKFVNTGGEKGQFGANNVRGRGRGRGKGGKGTTRGTPKLCSYYGKQSHLVDTCYQKHGFPPHLQPNHSNGVPLSANSVNSMVVVSNAECNPRVIQNESKISLDGIFSDRQKEALIALFQ
ncbi:uncharacterized protein LOC107474702 [Arachis duranensis]|uniref:Uncharacterized protein LOC107474702 n=1 Tax=Arachis duranensis TaxID=130453 RepID=A0A9C6WPZ0_ARADU|nr:uncharacterized protein LOC107474702 [Arachis duranensis]